MEARSRRDHGWSMAGFLAGDGAMSLAARSKLFALDPLRRDAVIAAQLTTNREPDLYATVFCLLSEIQFVVFFFYVTS